MAARIARLAYISRRLQGLVVFSILNPVYSQLEDQQVLLPIIFVCFHKGLYAFIARFGALYQDQTNTILRAILKQVSYQSCSFYSSPDMADDPETGDIPDPGSAEDSKPDDTENEIEEKPVDAGESETDVENPEPAGSRPSSLRPTSSRPASSKVVKIKFERN